MRPLLVALFFVMLSIGCVETPGDNGGVGGGNALGGNSSTGGNTGLGGNSGSGGGTAVGGGNGTGGGTATGGGLGGGHGVGGGTGTGGGHATGGGGTGAGGGTGVGGGNNVGGGNGVGGGTAVGGGTGTGGGSVDAGSNRFGYVSFYTSQTGPSWASANFYEVLSTQVSSSCVTTQQGQCSLTVCGPVDGGTQVPYVFRSAGTVGITGGQQPVALYPQGNMYSVFNTTGSLYTGGTQLTVSAAGATVPAFSANVTAPTQVQLTSPTPPAPGAKLQLYRNQPLSFGWAGSSVGTLQVTVGSLTVGAPYVMCQFPASQGSATIPASTLSNLLGGPGYIAIIQNSQAKVHAGAWEISLTASTSATSGGTTLGTILTDVN